MVTSGGRPAPPSLIPERLKSLVFYGHDLVQAIEGGERETTRWREYTVITFHSTTCLTRSFPPRNAHRPADATRASHKERVCHLKEASKSEKTHEGLNL